jgi:UDP-glucuronate 4-epimerase
LRLLQACRDEGINRVIFASSSSVYGSVIQPAEEMTTPCLPLSPYGASKAGAEALCSAYANTFGMDITALRFFTVYGPRQRPDMAISKFTDLIENGREVVLFGDGTTRRDYTFVTDIVEGIVACLERDLPGYKILNLGGGNPIELLHLIRVIEGALGKSALIRHVPPQEGDPDRTHADIRSAQSMIGYRPMVSIEAGIQAFVEWYRSSTADAAAASGAGQARWPL